MTRYFSLISAVVITLSCYQLLDIVSFFHLKCLDFIMDSHKVAQAVCLIDEGHSVRYVAQQLNVARSTLHYAVKRYRETQSYNRRPGQGRKRCTSARDDRFIVSQVLRNRFATAVEVRQELQNVRNVNVNEHTVRNRLKESNLTARRPYKAPELLIHHRRARLEYARQYVNWTPEQWSNVLFSDETRVSLRGPDGRQRVYRRRNERFEECTLVNTVPFNGGSIMFWGGISTESRTELVFFDRGALNAERYEREVLEDIVAPFAALHGDNFVLMHDNARPHTARNVTAYLNATGIATLGSPACSPDLNPIEHIWDALKRRVRPRTNRHMGLGELKNLIHEEWDNIPQELIRNVILSMTNRLREVIRARGGNTRY